MLVIEALTTGWSSGDSVQPTGVGIIKLIGWLGGLPATTDVLFFFYSGPRLFPFIAGLSLLAAFAIRGGGERCLQSLSRLAAMRVTPRQAMASED